MLEFWSVPNFYAKVEVVGDCWLWTGYKNKRGYGTFRFQDRVYLAHRFAYMLFEKPLAKRKVLHHLCPNKNCVNPSHLKLMPWSDHSSLHGKRPRIRKVHCRRGHRMTGDNVWISPDGSRRRCRKCDKIKSLQST